MCSSAISGEDVDPQLTSIAVMISSTVQRERDTSRQAHQSRLQRADRDCSPGGPVLAGGEGAHAFRSREYRSETDHAEAK